ncbi:MAG: hypothetical protein RIC35_18795 [Marinoscillum sp.]
MKRLIYLFTFILLISSCDEENLFDTVEAPAPIVTSTEWEASALDGSGEAIYTTGFAEGGRLFRLPAPNNDSTGTAYRDINVQTLLSSGDSRLIDSVTVEFIWIPSFPSNGPQSWVVYDAFKLADSEVATTYQFDYNYNLDTWMDNYACYAYGVCGFDLDWVSVGPFFGINITREDNSMRLRVHFNDGSEAVIAKVQFGLPKTEAGLL